MKRFVKFIAWAFKVAYRPGALGIAYQRGREGLTTKTILESLSALLALIAAYSDLSQRVLEFLPLKSWPYSAITKSATALLGVFVCGHIIYSTERNGTVFSYGRIPRVFSSFAIWIVLIGFVLSIDGFLTGPIDPNLNRYTASFQIPATAWRLQQMPGSALPGDRTYIAKLAIPPEARRPYRDVTVAITAGKGHTLRNFSRNCEKVIPSDQEPLQLGEPNQEAETWVFPDFQVTLGWELIVTIGKSDPNQPPSSEIPFQALVYLSN